MSILAGIGLGLSVGGSIFGAHQSYKAAKSKAAQLRKQYEAARRQSLYKAQVSEFNAMILDSRKEDLKKQESMALLNNLKQGKDIEASQRVSMAGSGIMLGSGTASEIRKTTMWQNSLEADAIRQSYSRGRWDFALQANAAREEAMMYRRSASTYDNVDLSVSSTPYILNAITGIGQAATQAATVF